MNFSKYSTMFALLTLAFMGFVAITSIMGDAVTVDESPHITAGYSYLRFQDFRLNPEHPPLVKDIAAFPLLFKNLNFPLESPAWTDLVNGQWDMGPQFLYDVGNDPDKVIFWGRMGPILITLLFGWFVFKWSRELFGNSWALITLFFFAFSPTIMAHGRLVTTDVPAAFAFFLAIYFYIKLLKAPSVKNLLAMAVIFAIAQLTKFSLVTLLVFLPAITLLWIICTQKSINPFKKDTLKGIFLWKLRFLAMFGISVVLITAVYQFHVLNYPVDMQIRDIAHILVDDRFSAIRDALIWTADKPVLRAFGHYALGVTMVFLRVSGGNTAYFLGEVSNNAWPHYFPVVFALKEPFAILLLVLLSFMLWLKNIFGLRKKIRQLPDIVRNNFDEIAILAFLVFYWTISITGNLNLGVRHIIPTLPFMYMLISGQLRRWVRYNTNFVSISNIKSVIHILRQLAVMTISGTGKVIVISILLGMNAISFIGIYPHYIAYFNTIAGGPNNGYKYVVDSNLDWGQDLRRLKQFVEDNNIESIKVDYFGGGNIKYYLGDKAIVWHADKGETTGWIAVSASYYQTSRAYPNVSYEWLDKYEPEAKIGYSIFVFHIE